MYGFERILKIDVSSKEPKTSREHFECFTEHVYFRDKIPRSH